VCGQRSLGREGDDLGDVGLTGPWDFRQGLTKSAGALVPDVYACGPQPLSFPDVKCTTRSTISAFNHRDVALPFRCVATASQPPPGVNATLYSATVTAQAEAAPQELAGVSGLSLGIGLPSPAIRAIA